MADASLFRWQAVDSQGQLVSGQLLAIDSDNLLLMLAQRDLLPVSWKREKCGVRGSGSGSTKPI